MEAFLLFGERAVFSHVYNNQERLVYDALTNVKL